MKPKKGKKSDLDPYALMPAQPGTQQAPQMQQGMPAQQVPPGAPTQQGYPPHGMPQMQQGTPSVQQTNPYAKQPKKQEGLPKWVLIPICIVLAISLGANGFLAWRIFSGPGYTFSFKTGLIGGPDIIQQGTLEEEEPQVLEERLKNKDEPYKVSYIFNMKPYFPAGDLPGSLSFENPPESMYDMRFTVYLEDWTHVYTSPKLKPCEYIVSAKLNKNLDAGLYKATAYLSFYDQETGVYMGRKSAPIVLNVAS